MQKLQLHIYVYQSYARHIIASIFVGHGVDYCELVASCGLHEL